MNSGTWKNAELEWAAILGGVRVPITGRARGNVADVAHDLYAIEVKKVGQGKRPYVTEKLKDAIDQAVQASATAFKQDGISRTPLVGIEQTNGSRRIERYVVLRLEDFLEITSTGGSDD